MNRIALILLTALLLILSTPTAHARWKGKTWQNPTRYKQHISHGLNFRPRSPDQKTLVVSDYRLRKLPVNIKGINIGVTRLANGTAWAFRNIIVKHCRISHLTRTPGWHSDFIRISGAGRSTQDVPTRILLEDIYVHDGDVLPLIIQDGRFDRITIRHWRMRNVASSIQLCAMNTGTIDEIHIEDSPGISVAICGRPGAIKRVYVKNCPGSRIRDCDNRYGKSGCQIIYN